MSSLVLSVSNVTTFDHDQPGGCERKHWFERTSGLKPEQSEAQLAGEAGHALLAEFFLTGKKPEGRVKMGKAVTGAIVKGDLPKPGPDMLVEYRFDGQKQRTPEGEWIPVDPTKTLYVGGLPWDGMIDLAYRRGDVPDVLDHKFYADIEHLPPASELVKTIQMPVYVMALQRIWPDAKTWRIGHHYVSKKGVDSKLRWASVTNDEIAERRAHIEGLVTRIKAASIVEVQDDVPFNRRSCEITWPSGFTSLCPHQSICRAYREKNKVSLSAEEALMFSVPVPSKPAAQIPDSAPAKTHRIQIVEAPTAEVGPAPVPSAAPAPVGPELVYPEGGHCTCGAAVTSENGSKLQSGAWKHIGCPLDSPPPAAEKPKAEKKAKAPKPAPEPKATPPGVPPKSLEPAPEPLTSSTMMPPAPFQTASFVTTTLHSVTNPKDAVGSSKAPISTLSMRVLAEVGVAMLEGACKYGRHNYRAAGVRASVYLDAAVMRHIGAWWEGRDIDPASGLHEITKAIAGLMVLRDSIIQGNWVDDRPPKTADAETWIEELNAVAAKIVARYPEPEGPRCANREVQEALSK